MVFSTNQNRQLYVAAGIESSIANIQGAANIGKICVGTDKDGCKFITQNGFGGLTRSDLIDPKSIMWATVSGPKDTEIKLKAYALELKSAVNSGNPIVGQDYIVRINFRQMYGMSDENIYQKYGAVHATSAVKGDFLKEMAFSLVKNFKRLYSPLVYVGLADASNFTLIKSATKDSSGNITFTYVPTAEMPASYNSGGGKYQASAISSPTKLIIAEMSQVDDWALGTKQYTPVYFEVIPTTVTDATAGEVEWGTVTPYTDYKEVIGNGYKYADLEYFCMGERGDQYRKIGWPNAIETKYFVNPTSTYYSLDIQYAYLGTCEDIQKSEKTMTILFPSSTSKDTIDSVVEALGIANITKYPENMPTIKFKKDTYTVAKSGTVTVKAIKQNSDSGTIEYSITIPGTGGATGTTVDSSTGVVTASTTAGLAIVTATLKESTTTVDTATCTVEVG